MGGVLSTLWYVSSFPWSVASWGHLLGLGAITSVSAAREPAVLVALYMILARLFLYSPTRYYALVALHAAAATYLYRAADKKSSSFVRRYLTFPLLAQGLVILVSTLTWQDYLQPIVLPTAGGGIISLPDLIDAAFNVALFRIARFAVRSIVFPAPLVHTFARIGQDQAKEAYVAQGNWREVKIAVTPASLLSSRRRHVYMPTSPLGEEPAVLEGAVFLQRRNPTAKWLVYLGGNAECYELSLPTVEAYCSELGCNGVVFNPRGVRGSSGWASNTADLMADASSVITYLVNKCATEERYIVLFGHSIGGGIAANVIQKYHPGCYLLCDRTFSTLSAAAAGFVPALNPTFVSYGIRLCFGELDTWCGWCAVPSERRLCLYHKRDQIIGYPASLAKRILDESGGDGSSQEPIELAYRDGFAHVDAHNTSTRYFWGHAAMVKHVLFYLTGKAVTETKKGA